MRRGPRKEARDRAWLGVTAFYMFGQFAELCIPGLFVPGD
jgi:hypothetical protein